MTTTSEISKSRFKAHALEILREIEHSGQPVIITDRGRQALKISKYVPRTGSALDRLKGSVTRFDEPMTPLEPGLWEAQE